MTDATVLTTERMRLRSLRATDLEWLAALHADPRVMRYVRPPQDRASTAIRLDELIAQQRANPRLGVFPAELHAGGRVVGWFVLTHLDGGSDVELGYRLFVDAWGQGLATEGACALAHHAQTTLQIDPLVAVAHVENVASQRVLEKAGFERLGLRRAYDADLAYFERRSTQLPVGAGYAGRQETP